EGPGHAEPAALTSGGRRRGCRRSRRRRPEAGRRGGSDAEALAGQPGRRVDAAGAGVDLEVQVGAGDVAGRADAADDLAGGDLLADADVDRRLVGVPDLGTVV